MMWRNSRSGFTLLEMIVTIAVMGLVLAMLATALPPRSPRLATALAATRVAQALRAARGQAIAQGVPVAVVLPALNGVSAQMPPGGIVFAPDGSASGGMVVLAGSGGRAALRVDWLTGQVAIAAP